MKKFITIALIAAMMLSMIVVGTSAAAWDGTTSTAFTGTGTADDPYVIASAENLKYLQEQVAAGNKFAGKYITQTADIDLGGKEWTPIGTSGAPFCGVYDGKGFKISGFKITKSSSAIGLFGYICATADYEAGIANVNLAGEITIDAINTDAGLGSLVGWLHKDATDNIKRIYVINVVSDVDITLTNCAKQPRSGAIVGYAFRATVENVVNNGDFNYSGTGSSRVGGIVGQTNRSTFINCVNNGNITVDSGTTNTTARGAGIVAVVTRGGDADGTEYTTFENCVNNGAISVKTGGNAFTAGIAADFFANYPKYENGDVRTKFISCVNTGTITSETTTATNYGHAGGIIGYSNRVYVSGVGYDIGGIEFNKCVNSGTTTTVGGKEDRSGGITGSVYSPSKEMLFDQCLSTGSLTSKCFSLKNKAGLLDTSTANADPAVAAAAIKTIEDAIVPSTYKIAGFPTGYVAPPAPETTAPAETTAAPAETTAAPAETTAAPAETTAAPSTPSTPNTGDVTSVILLALVAACAGAVLTIKKTK